MKNFGRKALLIAGMLAMAAPAFASPTGTDPEPGIIRLVRAFFGF